MVQRTANRKGYCLDQ